MAGGLLSPDIDMAMAALLLIAILIFTLVRAHVAPTAVACGLSR
jgi:hypothetical protein